MELVVLGLVIGLDNLRASAAIGVLGLDRRRRAILVATFGITEAVFPLLGVVLGAWLVDAIGGAADVVGAAGLVLASALLLLGVARGLPEGRVSRATGIALFVLPAGLALDNLAAGTGLAALGVPVVPAALVIGMLSAAVAVSGLAVGGLLRRAVGRGAPVLSAALLVVGALATLLVA